MMCIQEIAYKYGGACTWVNRYCLASVGHDVTIGAEEWNGKSVNAHAHILTPHTLNYRSTKIDNEFRPNCALMLALAPVPYKLLQVTQYEAKTAHILGSSVTYRLASPALVIKEHRV